MNKFVISSALLFLVLATLLSTSHATDEGMDLDNLVDTVDEADESGAGAFGPHMLLVLALGAIAAFL